MGNSPLAPPKCTPEGTPRLSWLVLVDNFPIKWLECQLQPLTATNYMYLGWHDVVSK